MAFKLIRVDSEQPLKLKLPVGKHIMGRGNFLNIHNICDKRVSRNHAELEVTEDVVTIKSLHQNPCFYIKKNTDETQILKQNDSIVLSSGDKFGILPETYWYEVILCTSDDTPDITDRLQNSFDVNSECTDIVDDKVENADVTDCELSERLDNSQDSGSPSLLASEQCPEVNQDQSSGPGDVQTSPSEHISKPVKRSHSEDAEDESKRVRTSPEPVTVKQESVDGVVKDEPADSAMAGPSNDQGNVSNDNKPPSPAKQAMLRERCMYGDKCYRRNPQHKAHFSHPGDRDWGSGERGVCPYGGGCRKRDPRHWAQNSHPPGVQPPPNAPQPGMRVVEKRGNIFYINANTVNFYDDHFEVEDSEGDSVDYDYEF